MVNYSQNDVRVIIGGNDLFCDTASISYTANISPNYTVASKSSVDFHGSAPPKGSLQLTYYLTGSDPVADKINGEPNLSLNFNSLTVNSGYLSSYSLSLNPHSSIKINATFDFYEKVKGTFATSQQSLSDISPLTASDLSLENGSLVVSDNILDLSYSYQTTFSPVYEVNSSGVDAVGVRRNQQKVSASFNLYDYDLTLPADGQSESFKINLKDKNDASLQLYYINGKLSSKSFSAQVGNTPSSSYEIVQATMGGETPTISGINPSQGATGSAVMVSGNNLTNVDHAFIGEYECSLAGTPSYNSTTQLYEANITVPRDMLSGYISPVKIITNAGEAIGDASSVFTCNDGVLNF